MQHQPAIGDVFGTNIFDVRPIFLADAIYRGEPVPGQAGWRCSHARCLKAAAGLQAHSGLKSS